MTTQAVSGRRYFTKAWLLEQKSLIALLVLIAIVSTLSPNFFTVNNLFNILQQTSVNAIMAVGMTLVILTSGIDLSVGSLLALTGAVAASIVGVEVNALVALPPRWRWALRLAPSLALSSRKAAYRRLSLRW